MNPGTTPDPLAQLRSLHQPPDPSAWPLAPGWWLLALLVLLAGLGLIWLIRWWRRPTARRLALRELQRLQGCRQHDDFHDRLAAWWRRCAMARDGQQVAGLTGDRWKQQLQQAAPGVDISSVHRDLFEARYQRQPGAETDARQLLEISRRWAREALR